MFTTRFRQLIPYAIQVNIDPSNQRVLEVCPSYTSSLAGGAWDITIYKYLGETCQTTKQDTSISVLPLSTLAAVPTRIWIRDKTAEHPSLSVMVRWSTESYTTEKLRDLRETGYPARNYSIHKLSSNSGRRTVKVACCRYRSKTRRRPKYPPNGEPMWSPTKCPAKRCGNGTCRAYRGI
jgi:hypothetical protein